MLVGAAFTARRTDIGKAAERRETREIHGTGGRANTADLLESGTKSGADAFSGPPFRVRFFGQLYQESGPRTPNERSRSAAAFLVLLSTAARTRCVAARLRCAADRRRW